MRTKINRGAFREEITIQKEVTTRNENGHKVSNYEDYIQLRCQRKTFSTREYNEAGRENTDLKYKFVCHKFENDTSEMSKYFIKWNDKLFNINHVDEIDFQFIEITATMKG